MPKDRDRLSLWLLPALAAAMFLTDQRFTFLDDETWIITKAIRPVSETIDLFLRGGQNEHPPLYDLLLHGWLLLTGRAMQSLRLPSIAFFAVGLWLLARTARDLAGPSAERALLWIGVLWPFGFHYGRLAAWYSFVFFLTAWTTYAYIRFLHAPSLRRWSSMALAGLSLVYSNYFGWAIIGCLTLDFAIEKRERLKDAWLPVAGTLALLLLLYFPLWRAFSAETRGAIKMNGSLSAVLYGAFNLYTLLVSESVAPWFWALSIPAAIGILLSLSLSTRYAPPRIQKFLFYFVLQFAAMLLTGIIGAKRLLLISPWLLLALAGSWPSLRGKVRGKWFAASLSLIAAVGWFGIVTRQFYAAPRFVEPWPQVAGRAAQILRNGGVVVADPPSFFFYLHYALDEPLQVFLHRFANPNVQVYDLERWIQVGEPVAHTTFLVQGVSVPMPWEAAAEAQHRLDASCVLEERRQFVRDRGYELKRRFFPKAEQLEWRIESREYKCSAAQPAPGLRR